MRNGNCIPFEGRFLNSIGRGQDNVVVPLSSQPNWVIKWNHDYKEDEITNKDYYNRLLYKKRKYEIFTRFLPEFIPETSFLLGPKKDGSILKIKEYTVQKRVPQLSISDLSMEELCNDKFQYNLYLLLIKLSNMYKTVNFANLFVDDIGKVDVRLDLGGLSKTAEESRQINFQDFSSELIEDKNFCKSPNLLVDPVSLNLYCIDFGRGIWNEYKESTYSRILELSRTDELEKIIELSNPY